MNTWTRELWSFFKSIMGAARTLSQNRNQPQRPAIFLTFFRLRSRLLWLKFKGKNVTSERVLGFNVRFFKYETLVYLFEEIFVTGSYQSIVIGPKKNHTPIIVDAGSNIGISVLFFKWLYPNAEIHAFEPDPRTFTLLEENCRTNHLTSVFLHNIALSNKAGISSFFSHQAGSLVASLNSDRTAEQQEKYLSVKSERLSHFISKPIDLLKMDIEGAEADCFDDLADQGKLNFIHEIVLECHHNLNGGRNILTAVLPRLEKEGYVFQLKADPGPSVDSSQDVALHAIKKTPGLTHHV